MREALLAEVEAAALREVRSTYASYSHTYFKRTLRQPNIVLVDDASVLGRWVSATRALELSRGLLHGQPWGVLLEVLKHEMAHQYVDEVLGCRTETAHGPVFRKVCEERGIDASATGVPTAAGAPVDDERARLFERVTKLLALAASDNQHEAESAMSAAQRLMLKYNLQGLGRGQASSYVTRHLGEPSGRVETSQKILAGILGEHFFVSVIWVPVWRVAEQKRGSVLEVTGTAENVELADYVHAFLNRSASELWRAYRRERKLGGNAQRRTFEAGVMSGFRKKLTSEALRSRGEGLVWAGDAELERWAARRHPHVRRVTSSGPRLTAAYGHGQSAGAKLVLHRGVGSGPSGGGPRLLKG